MELLVCETNGHCTVVRCGKRCYPLGYKLGAAPAEPICTIYKAGWSQLRGRADVVDLSSRLPPIWNQGEIGSCTAQSLAALIGGCYRVNPSRLFLYHCGRAVGELPTHEDTGCTMADAIKGVQLYGFCDESVFPYDEAKSSIFPPWQAFQTAVKRDSLPFESVRLQAEDMMACLAEGCPLVLGIAVYRSMFDKSTIASGVIPTPNPQLEQLMGGHAITISGYDRTARQFFVRNSWGTEWGQNGYGRISFDYLTRPDLAMDAYTLRAFGRA